MRACPPFHLSHNPPITNHTHSPVNTPLQETYDSHGVAQLVGKYQRITVRCTTKHTRQHTITQAHTHTHTRTRTPTHSPTHPHPHLQETYDSQAVAGLVGKYQRIADSLHNEDGDAELLNGSNTDLASFDVCARSISVLRGSPFVYHVES